MWADSTWTGRRQLMVRFLNFVRRRALLAPADPVQLDWCIVLFCEETNVAPAGKLQYSKDLAALLRRMELGTTLPVTKMYQSSLRGSGGLVPTNQAVAAAPTQVQNTLVRAEQEGPRLLAAVFLTWKTASRWDEITKLTKQSFLASTPREIIISWGDRTKTTRASDPFRASGYGVVHHPQDMTWLCNTINSLHPNEYLINWTTGQFVRWLQRGPSTPTLTAHSFKRGALSFLLALFNKNIINKQHLNVLSILAKHKTIMDFPSMTIRYMSEDHETARMLGTQHLTIHIPCKWPPTTSGAASPARPSPFASATYEMPAPPPLHDSDEDTNSSLSSSSASEGPARVPSDTDQDDIPFVRRFRMPLVRSTATPSANALQLPPRAPPQPRRRRANTLPVLLPQPVQQRPLVLTTEMDGDTIPLRVEQRRMSLAAQGYPMFNNTGHGYYQGH